MNRFTSALWHLTRALPFRRNVWSKGPLASVFVSLLVGCQSPQSSAPLPISLDFQAVLGGQPFSCQGEFPGVELHQLKLFVYDLRLLSADGHETPVAIQQLPPWQKPGKGDEGLVLLDYENGTGHCKNGTPGTHTSVLGSAPAGVYTGLSFRLGVPFSLNHGDPIRAQPPLNDSTMHWNWQGGYKFLRLDGKVSQQPYIVHIGSTGCEGTFTNVTRCTRENRADVSLSGLTWTEASAPDSALQVRHAQISIHLEPLLQGSGDGCMAEADNPACEAIYHALHLDLGTGKALTGGDPQTVFTAP